ncbi:hypothetical protein KFL_003070050 [Klebsormidium nitens]|uniref:Uncharacterized protein n=1 Tax=Klebsormidium nitens TaxID=105231 RepID=A0A1Y1IDC5_KLENI|nr:hypothetical protein KFL_003070050 [Klebsormidium nitens]|eukprot:GAQ86717.1 hypothetical protein KFL_003070050 [Klebsormidium nitens]
MLDIPPAVPGAAGQAGHAVPLNAPAREAPTKPPASEKKPLLPPGFDFVRLPNGELKLVPQQGLQAQRRRESNAASKLIVNASKEARRLVRGVYKEHRNAVGRRGLVPGGKSGSPQKRSDIALPPILQETSSASTRIAALRALEALGSINLNPTVRHPPQPQVDIGNPWATRPNGAGQGLGQPTKPNPPRRKPSSSSVWRLYGVLPNQAPAGYANGQAAAPPPAKKRKNEAADVTPQVAAIRLALGLTPMPPVMGPTVPITSPEEEEAAPEGTVSELEAQEEAIADMPDMLSEPVSEAPATTPDPAADTGAAEADEADAGAETVGAIHADAAAPPEEEAEGPPQEALADLSPPGEEMELVIEDEGFGILDEDAQPAEAEGEEGEPIAAIAESAPPPPMERDPRLPLEGTYAFSFLADPGAPGTALELPPGVLRREGTLRDRASLKYPKKMQGIAPGANMRRLAVDVTTAPDREFDAKVEVAVKLAKEEASPLTKTVAWAAQQLQVRGAVMMTSVTEHYYHFLGEEFARDDWEALPPAHLMDLIQGRLYPLVAASSFSKKHGYMLHRKLGVQHLYEAMTELRVVERRRNRAAGFPAYVPPNARGATNKRGPKPAGMSAREITEVVGTLGVHPGLEEGARREPQPRQTEEEEEENETTSPRKARTKPASRKTGWL